MKHGQLLDVWVPLSFLVNSYYFGETYIESHVLYDNFYFSPFGQLYGKGMGTPFVMDLNLGPLGRFPGG